MLNDGEKKRKKRDERKKKKKKKKKTTRGESEGVKEWDRDASSTQMSGFAMTVLERAKNQREQTTTSSQNGSETNERCLISFTG